ncbi:hypothetical protein Hamer_G003979 [Homarus americanus]|uniref:Uncharacterized protein n=1 Tax=Homarus americanus TaxID=6706 RepID=A0A8J5TM36_HOMAM|nr:hypothetical protein Hamer_G003979 [Homarus americanus]
MLLQQRIKSFALIRLLWQSELVDRSREEWVHRILMMISHNCQLMFFCTIELYFTACVNGFLSYFLAALQELTQVDKGK